MAQTPLLRLLAHDEDDLGVISAALQTRWAGWATSNMNPRLGA